VSDPRTDIPVSRRDLAVVVRFVDGFTGQPVRLPLSVSIPQFTGIDPRKLTSMPSGKWIALWSDADATYRFSLPNLPLTAGSAQLPTGTFNLLVTTTDGVNLYANPPIAPPRGPYAALIRLQVTIPPTATHPPPVLASDYLVELPLWPTAAFHVPDGETAVSGWVVSADRTNVAGLKLKLFESNTGPSGEPWTSTDSAGQFLYRLPNLPRPAGPNPQATLNVEMVDQTNAPLMVAPATLTVSIGKSTSLVQLLVP
jgi:hypothetical protein